MPWPAVRDDGRTVACSNEPDVRVAVVPLLALVAAGCGAVQHDRASMSRPPRPVTPVHLSSPGADATRAQWYAALKRSRAGDAQPALSQSDVERSVRQGAAAVGVSVVEIRFLPFFGGSADVVVEPGDPVSFAEHAGMKITTLLGRLDDNAHAYLVTVADSGGPPLFMLGWVPEQTGRWTGEGMAWQAPGIRSDAVFGVRDTSNKLLQGCRATEPCSVMAPK